ncbi:hypothetical protein [Natronorubrum halophilum]|uniref:hypothetical protein n=1 Tax=Natronorubrum halophilum TaxID=1702106 RepID=UPI0013CECA72|nr:hypothetical protein [Natronorubrum halophilum]
MSTTRDNSEEETGLPSETEALIEALHRKTNYQVNRIDELEQKIEDLEAELKEARE